MEGRSRLFLLACRRGFPENIIVLSTQLAVNNPVPSVRGSRILAHPAGADS